MIDIDVNLGGKPKESPARGRSVFALGWVRFKLSPQKEGAAEDEMRVLGMMLVQDDAEALDTKESEN